MVHRVCSSLNVAVGTDRSRKSRKSSNRKSGKHEKRPKKQSSSRKLLGVEEGSALTFLVLNFTASHRPDNNELTGSSKQRSKSAAPPTGTRSPTQVESPYRPYLEITSAAPTPYTSLPKSTDAPQSLGISPCRAFNNSSQMISSVRMIL